MNAFLSNLAGMVLIVCVVPASGLGVQQLSSRKVKEFDEKISSKFLRERVYGTSLSYCHMECLEDKDCLSFFYDHVNTTCQTHGVVFVNPDDGEWSPGNTYYNTIQDFCPSELGYIYNRALMLCYKLHYPETAGYISAQQVCQSEGGDLITLDTEAKLLHITQTVTASTFPASPPFFIIGAHGGVVAGDWRWVDGQQIDPVLWCPDEPNRVDLLAETAYVSIMPDGSGCMDDIPEGFPCHFFCELKV